MVSSCRALLCASLLLIADASALWADHPALPRRYLNVSSIAPLALAPPSQTPSSQSPSPDPSPPTKDPVLLDDGAEPPKPEKESQSAGDDGPHRTLSSSSTPTPSLTSFYGNFSTSRTSNTTSTAVSITKSGSTTTSRSTTTSWTTTTKPQRYTSRAPATTSSTPDCIPLAPNEPLTVFIILPNPETVTVTLGGNYTAILPTPVPEFVPPTFCPEPVTGSFPPINLPPSSSSSKHGLGPGPTATASADLSNLPAITMETEITKSTKARPVTTVITTSKNPVTIFTSAPEQLFPGSEGSTNKQTVLPPGADAGPNAPAPFPTNTPTRGAEFQEAPQAVAITTEVQGVPVEIRTDVVVIGGSTFNPTAGATGAAPGAVMTSAPQPTNVVIIDGAVFSAIGSTVAVFDGETVLYGSSSTFTTLFHHETITFGNAITFDGTTIGGAANTGTQLGIAGGISVSQIGPSVAVVSSTSLTVGPGATVTTIYIDTYTVVANSLGLAVAGTTLSYPFNTATFILTFGGITFTQIGSTILVLGGSTYTVGPTSGTKTSSFNLAASPTAPAPAAETSKDAGAALKPMYLLLSVCLLICIERAI